jgi:membrane associated rhomboid family serine protease
MDPTWTKQESGLDQTATVAVHEAATEREARNVASMLLEAGIPAALEQARPAIWVVVPWERQREADALLRRLAVPVIPRFTWNYESGGELAPPSLTWSPELHDTVTTTAWSADRPELDEEERAFVREPPDSGPVGPRLILALSAIGFGIALQRAVEVLIGERGAVEAFAASSSHPLELWRYVTAGFVHFGPMHHLANAIFGVLIGVVLLGTHGVGATMMAWVVSTMIGVGAEAAFTPLAWIAGASAGNYGLVGLWAKGQLDRSHVSLLPRRERLRTAGMLLLLLPGALTPVTSSGSRVAVLAHVAGFVAGFLCGYVFERRMLPESFDKIARRSSIGQWCAIAMVGMALAAALGSLLERVT